MHLQGVPAAHREDGRMTRPFSPDDLYLHHKVSELHCDRASGTVACTVRSVDRDSDDYLSCIWALRFDGAPALQLTGVWDRPAVVAAALLCGASAAASARAIRWLDRHGWHTLG